MLSEFPYGYVEFVNGRDDKDCEQGKQERVMILVISSLHVET